jgi:hypothetical protein
MKKFKNYTSTHITETTSSYIPYETYCGLLDYIGENYYNLNEETLVEDWWSDLTPTDQSKYISDHPDSDKAKNAREREDGDKDKKPSLKDKVKSLGKNLFSKEKTAAALKDLKSHVDGVVKSVGVDAKLVTKAFKEPSVYNTVNALGGSVNAAAKTAIGSLRTIGKTLDIGGAMVTDTKAFKQLEKGIIKADDFMDKYPALKVVGSAALVGLATKQWLDMSFSGDIESDYDLGIIADAARGKASFADFIGTPQGIKGMALLGAGLATGGAPLWIAGQPLGLGLALTYSGLKKVGESKAGKKVKAKMVEMGKKAQDKIQKGAKAVDKKLGVKSEEHKMKKFKELYTEVASVAQRKKLARRMAKMARSPVVQMKKKRASLKMRPPAKIAQLARKKIIKHFRDKFYPGYGDMAFQQRVKVDQMIMQKYGKKIDKMYKKMAKKLQKLEIERVKKAKASQKAEKNA